MVNKVLFKETKNFIAKNKKTYIAQIIIIMLGVGFFVGMKISSFDLQSTMTKFVEDYNFYDLKVNLEYGIDNSDIENLKTEVAEIKYIEGSYSQDIVKNIDGKDYAIRLHSYNQNKSINRLKLKEGHFPQNIDECVIDINLKEKFKIGDMISLDNELLNNKTMKIVGVVQSPEYLAIDRGNSSLLSGKINYYVFINENNVNSNVYSDLYLKFDTDKKSFTKEYNEFIERKEIETTYSVSGYFKEKYNEIISDQQIKITSAKAEYQLQKTKVDAEVIEAENEIKNKQELLNDAKNSLMDGDEIANKVNSADNATVQEEKKKLDALKKNMDDLENQYNYYKNQYDNANKNIQNKIDENNNKIKKLDSEIASLESTLKSKQQQYNSISDSNSDTLSCSKYPGSQMSSDGKQCCYNYGYRQFCYPATAITSTPNYEKIALKNEITNLENQIAAKKVEKADLQKANTVLQAQINNSINITSYENAYLNAKAEYEKQLEIYNSLGNKNKLEEYYKEQNKILKQKIAQYEYELSTAKSKLEQQKNIAYSELESLNNQIIDAENLVQNLTYPKSYVFHRNDNAGYSQFVSDIEKISNLAIVIPGVFYFIAFFMIWASINRMLHEERNQIGTLKAIGIRNKEIALKYIFYSVSSVIIGSFLGIIIGVVLLPLLVYYIYNILYEFPAYLLLFNFKYFLTASIIALLVAITSTLICCYNTFKESPILLLKTKQEKATTKSVLENIPLIWNKLSLTDKMSLKNIFRYKVRMLMTIIGIGGCLALMLTGLSLRTSITEMIPTQYGKIFKVDAQVFYKDITSIEELNNATDQILQMGNIEAGLKTNFETFTSDYNDKSLNINLVTFLNDEFTDFIELKNSKTNQPIKPLDDGVIISEKLAKMQKLSVGSIIKIKNRQQQEYSMIVKGITKNYIEHYIYMNKEYYQKVFNIAPRPNMLLLKLDDNYEELELAKRLTSTNVVSQVLYISIAQEAYNNIMGNLALLVGVFVVFSVLLVFAVLYNLININIRERSKEIATYKVLGFENKKVISIVKREILVLTVIGVIVGILLGYVLSIIVIKTCEVENLNFLKSVTFQNIIISASATVMFTLCFSMIINKYVSNINLTESLKSNE